MDPRDMRRVVVHFVPETAGQDLDRIDNDCAGLIEVDERPEGRRLARAQSITGIVRHTFTA